MKRLLFAVLGLQVIALWPRERVEHIHTTHTAIVPVPAPLPIEHIRHVVRDTAHCPPPRNDVPAGKLTQPPEEIEHVRPSVTNSGWVAAWNAQHVYVSRNAGTTWERVHDGAEAVRGVGFDCFGRPLVVRGSIAGFDDDSDIVVIGGGPDLAVMGTVGDRGQLAVSRDGGASWQWRALVEGWETPVYGRQYEDGSFATIVQQGDCGGQAPYAFAFDAALRPIESTKLDVYYEFLDREGAIDGIDAYYRDTNIIEGPSPIVVATGREDEIARAYRYTKDGKATELPVTLTSAAYFYRADAAGRLWGIACGGVAIAPATRGTDPRAGSSDAVAAGRCDPS